MILSQFQMERKYVHSLYTKLLSLKDRKVIKLNQVYFYSSKKIQIGLSVLNKICIQTVTSYNCLVTQSERTLFF